MKERLYHYAKRVSLICILATQVGCAGLWVKEPTLYGADCDQSAKPAYLASAGALRNWIAWWWITDLKRR